ncbi:hypothetical protein DICVIV_06818 [Dictyocaulus viviparus]|uniref:DUF4211 domain-containing protein n=1 Tax=Dictyocaulus viviparus TaxID=29172 RepID=A0A0D8XRG5_DICVI|nr:hypothetical protein DICVIV_06818 [Dictyocaulus viviparus]
MSTLQQLSGLSAPLLPGSALGATQWANSQSTGQTWIDPAKVAAMLPMYQVFSGVKGLKIPQQELIGQQNIAPIDTSTIAATSSSSIFPTAVTKKTLRKSPTISGSPQPLQNSPNGGRLSSGPSSHLSTSTPQDIDVGVLSQPSSQTHAYDLTVRTTPPSRIPDEGTETVQDFSSRSENSFKIAPTSLTTNHLLHPSTSQSNGQPSVVDDNWAGIDLGDLDLFTGASSKDNDAAITIVWRTTQPQLMHFPLIFTVFTPPDSPSVCSSESNMMGLFGGPSTSSALTASTFSPFITTQASSQSTGNSKRKTDSVKPIAAPSPSSFKKEPLVTRPVQKFANDAYSFEDEEEVSVLGHVDPKDKLDAEVREKLSKITGHHPEMRNKNVYVPGVGFAIPPEQQQDLWRHVVPKKRPTCENRPAIPAVNLLPPSVHAEVSQATSRLSEPEIVTLAESIRRRKKERLTCAFIKTEQTYGSDCAKEEGADLRAEEISKQFEAQPRLPKLIIKLPRRTADSYYESKMKKKKRRKKDYDSDWEGSSKTKRKKRAKREKGHSGYELRIVERDQEECKTHRIGEERIDVSMLSRKRRLMMQWQEGQENQNRENGEHKMNIPSLSTRSRSEFNTEAIKTRLSKFGPADGHLPYSGWCDQVAYGYYRIAIKHIKQTRSEAIIRPEIPISDLFPAMTSECEDANGFVKADEECSTDSEDHVTMLRDPLRLSLYTFTLAMINHALTLEFFQQMKGKNDWNFLRAVSEIDKANTDSLSKLRGLVKFNEKIEDAIHSYTQLCTTESDFHSLQCQCCGLKSTERIIQLYALDAYDPETLQSVDRPLLDSSPLPAFEFLVCLSCANFLQLYHRCYHMKYHLLKKCEDKLEILGTLHPEFSPEKTVETARKCRVWLNRVLTEYIDLWKKIQNLGH